MPASDDIQEGLAEAFDVLSEEFLDGVTITLLKASEIYDEFDTVATINDKRFFEFTADGDYRKRLVLEIADASASLTASINEATHLGIEQSGITTIYTITAKDTTGPLSTDVTWKIEAELFDREARRFEAV